MRRLGRDSSKGTLLVSSFGLNLKTDIMKKLLIIIACFYFIQLSAQNEADFTNSEKQIQTLTAENTVMGVSGGVLVDGTLVWGSSSGYADKENNLPFTQTTLSRTASIAKPMTSIAVLQLFEKGLVDLDAPIQRYVDDFPIKEEGTITVRQLLNHSSGVPEYASKKEAFNAPNYASLSEAMNVFKDRELRGTPGVEEFYTSYGYVVLGVLIERITGQAYETYMQENVWDKAGMFDTGIEKAEEDYQNRSLLYHRKSNGKIKNEDYDNLSNRVPGGGLYSNVADLLKFGQAIIDFSLISEETMELMTEEQGTKYDGNPYALGWFLYSQSGERKDIFGHGGAQKGCNTQILIVPKRKTVVVIMANTSGSGGAVMGTSVGMMNEAFAKLKKDGEETSED